MIVLTQRPGRGEQERGGRSGDRRRRRCTPERVGRGAVGDAAEDRKEQERSSE